MNFRIVEPRSWWVYTDLAGGDEVDFGVIVDR